MPDRPLRSADAPAGDAFAGWARRIARGDRAALGELFDATYPALVATARRYTADAASVVYGTGGAVTLPVALVEGSSISDYDGLPTNPLAQPLTESVYGQRNGFRLPATFRADIGATLYFRRGPRPHALARARAERLQRDQPQEPLRDGRPRDDRPRHGHALAPARRHRALPGPPDALLPVLVLMRRLLALLACAAVAGCDFTPALDIDTPPHEARAVLRGLLVADSLAVVRVSRSADPFTGAPSRQVPTATDATVTLVRAGAPERLVLRPDTCFGDGYTTLVQGSRWCTSLLSS